MECLCVSRDELGLNLGLGFIYIHRIESICLIITQNTHPVRVRSDAVWVLVGLADCAWMGLMGFIESIYKLN